MQGKTEELKKFTLMKDAQGNNINLAGGSHNVLVGVLNGKNMKRYFAIKEVGCELTAMEEIIKASFMSFFRVKVPEMFLVYDVGTNENKYYIGSEIIPGFAPAGVLGINVQNNFNIDVSSGIGKKYKEWADKYKIPVDNATLNLYSEISGSNNKVAIRGLDNIFAAAVFVGDKVPFGKVSLSRISGTPFWNSHGFGYEKTPEKQLQLQKQQKRELFGNILLKPCKDETGVIYLKAVKIDFDGGFSFNPRPITGDTCYTDLVDLFYGDERRLLRIKWFIENSPNNIFKLYQPIMQNQQLSSQQTKLIGAKIIKEKITDSEIEAKVLEWVGSDKKYSGRKEQIILHFKNMRDLFVKYHELHNKSSCVIL